MFAYCGNNPVMYEDSAGNRYCAATTVEGESDYDRFISCDYQNELSQQKHNASTSKVQKTPEQIVMASEHFSFYKGAPVIKVSGSSSFSLGVIFLGMECDENLLRHEYGHVVQLKKLGLTEYSGCVVVPSVLCFWATELGVLSPSNYFSYPWEYRADQYGGAVHIYKSWAEAAADIYWNVVTGK